MRAAFPFPSRRMLRYGWTGAEVTVSDASGSYHGGLRHTPCDPETSAAKKKKANKTCRWLLCEYNVL